MQAVVLAAGQSSRFYPFSNGTHKTMVYLLGKPILLHTLLGVKASGIKDVVLVVRDDETVSGYFGDGRKVGLNIKYAIQREPSGMGDALLKAAGYIKGDFILLGGNHVNSEKLIKKLIKGKKNKSSGAVLVKQRENTWDYGVVALKDNFLFSVVEKPKKGTEPSNLCLASVYFLSDKFLSALREINKHQYSFEEALDNYAKREKIRVVITDEEILTLKYPWDLLAMKNFLLNGIKKHISKNVEVSKSAEIVGEVIIENGAKVYEGARIKGPCFIGKNVVVGNNALLRGGVDVEEGAVIGAYMEVKNTLIMKDSTTHSGFIGDSIVGENCKIAAQFCTANVRIDRETIKVVVKNSRVDTGLVSVGGFLGDNVLVGIKSSTMPGVIIGPGTIIGPSTTVIHNVLAGTRYYTKFKEVVEEKGE